MTLHFTSGYHLKVMDNPSTSIKHWNNISAFIAIISRITGNHYCL
jgi:hypothetical protein